MRKEVFGEAPGPVSDTWAYFGNPHGCDRQPKAYFQVAIVTIRVPRFQVLLLWMPAHISIVKKKN
jgi:hypothetical protein